MEYPYTYVDMIRQLSMLAESTIVQVLLKHDWIIFETNHISLLWSAAIANTLRS